MKICFILGEIGYGGHARSAISIAIALINKGHDVFFVGGNSGGEFLLKDNGLKYNIFDTGYKKNYIVKFGLKYKIHKILYKLNPDIIHAFDFSGLYLSESYARKYGKKILYTICGGPVPQKFIPSMKPIIVFSKELYEGIYSLHEVDKEKLLINAQRISFDALQNSKFDIYKWSEKDKINFNIPIVLCISRIANLKINSLKEVINCIDIVLLSKKVNLLIIGSIDDSHAFAVINELAKKVNEKHKFNYVTVTNIGSEYASKFLSIADILVGVGRSAFEGMFLGVPTLVLGEYGFSSVAKSATFDRLMAYNFSGRDVLNRKKIEINHMAIELLHILNDNEYKNRISEESKTWVRDNLDVNKGCEFYESIYNKDFPYFEVPKRLIFFKYCIYSFFRQIYKEIAPYSIQNKINYFRFNK
ncbi:Glycosyltransferase involved in cell wall bisynthesis [Desulfomicrobium apsheronum]|uniref:Glycosyltransferase involved in cell wall bisynthesis n=1 Tax=Desulfomicrobium apsheronum TaxID=52560 RepID=A0A1I3VZK4_9BACT|nr:glycosyltransferase [Desulfomicrobium apsheronum]SFJ99656.1 Glycosyltransferase involved in cell wall bisynthesis [Desulfomicrobium apsheronum]